MNLKLRSVNFTQQTNIDRLLEPLFHEADDVNDVGEDAEETDRLAEDRVDDPVADNEHFVA